MVYLQGDTVNEHLPVQESSVTAEAKVLGDTS
jgi:hypothetical protein